VRIAYLDPFSGASGEMIAGALLDAGLSLPALAAELGKLELTGYTLHAEAARQHGLVGTRFGVALAQPQPARDRDAIQTLIGSSPQAEPAKGWALAIFARLHEAGARRHGVDTIVAVCAACVGIALSDIEAVFSGPPRLGAGTQQPDESVTASLLAGVDAPLAGPSPEMNGAGGTLMTPAGAALLTTLAEFRRPDFAPATIEYGFGDLALPWPHALRLWLGDGPDPWPRWPMTGEDLGAEWLGKWDEY